MQMVIFVTACLRIVLLLRKSGTNFNKSEFYPIAPVLIFRDVQSFVLYSLSTISYILKKVKKKTVLSRLKVKTLFL